MAEPLVILAALVAFTFTPPILWLLWIRNTEHREREPWGQLAKMFAWGAIGGVILGVLFSVLLSRTIFLGPLSFVQGTALAAALLATVVAPIAEEPAKALGLKWVNDPRPEAEDGFVYGAAAGLGFAATETLFYVRETYLSGDFTAVLLVGVLRAFSSAFLHGTTTAIVGYGYLRRRSVTAALPFLLVAILVHAAYNGLLSAATFLSLIEAGSLLLNVLGFALAVTIAITGWRLVRHRVRALDAGA